MSISMSMSWLQQLAYVAGMVKRRKSREKQCLKASVYGSARFYNKTKTRQGRRHRSRAEPSRAANRRQIVGTSSANRRHIVGTSSANRRQIVGRSSANRWQIVGKAPANRRQIVGKSSANRRHIVDKSQANRRQIVDSLMTFNDFLRCLMKKETYFAGANIIFCDL